MAFEATLESPAAEIEEVAPSSGRRSRLPTWRRGRRTPGGSAHVQVVDGLRGIAILLVMAYHYWQLSFWVIPIPGVSPKYNLEFLQFAGQLGVDLFFFISAFCLFYPHAKAMFGEGKVPGLKHFYYRRFIKIVPSYALALLVIGYGFSSLYPSTWVHGKWADLAIHAVFLHNFLPQTLSSFNGVFWSLAVEVQFYVIFPLLARFCRRNPWLTTAGMVAVAVLYRAWSRDKVVGSFEQWDNQLPGYLDLFAGGMLTAYLVFWVRGRSEAAHRLRYVFTLLALVAFAILLMLFRWDYNIRIDLNITNIWKSDNRQWLALVFLCITLFSTFSINLWRRILANRVLLFLSTISYNLYLWHQAVGRVIRERGWYKASTVPPTSDPHWRWSYMFVAVGASIAVATVITYGFERPLLRRGIRGACRALVGWFVSGQPAPEPSPAPAYQPVPAVEHAGVVMNEPQPGGTPVATQRQPVSTAMPAAGERMRVVGVLNVTPDSFSDGGRYRSVDDAISWAERMWSDGAELIDVGGESTRPGAERVAVEVETARVVPVIRALAERGIAVSIDTMRASVAQAALEAGAQVVNDVSGGLGDPEMARVVREAGCPWILMHWRGHSTVMRSLASYDDVVADVVAELSQRVDAALTVGVDGSQLILDPGLGFAKKPEHDWRLLAGLDRLQTLGFPVLVGASRKSFLGTLLAAPAGDSRPVDQREDATTAITTYAALRGAWGVRVHQVRAAVDAATVVAAIERAGK
ncbi:dihydropteroate synthase [Frankineae bacterium MT45]|nr:dihydropteroate synthase [Frankineae bacterium MT45]